MKKCIECGATLLQDARFCTECGNEIKERTDLLCSLCGEIIQADDLFCTHCGAEVGLPPAEKIAPRSSKPRAVKAKKSTPASSSRRRKEKAKLKPEKKSSSKWVKVTVAVVILFLAYQLIPWSDLNQESNWVSSEYSEASPENYDTPDREYDPAFEQARQEYLEAYERYTRLATQGGEGDIRVAREEYQKKYQHYKELTAGKKSSSFVPPSKTTDVPIKDPSNIDHSISETLIKSINVGKEKQLVIAKGELSLNIPDGLLDQNDKELKIYKVEQDHIAGRMYEIELSNPPILFRNPVEITIPLRQGEDYKDFIAVDEVSQGVWMVMPAEYDVNSHSVKFNTYHFSSKGIINYIDSKLSGLGTKDFRKVVGWSVGSFGTAAGTAFIIGSATIGFKVTAFVVISGAVLSATGVIDPVSDPVADAIIKNVYTDLNTTLKVSDEFTVTWVNNTSSKSHLGGNKIQVCIDRISGQALFAVRQDISEEKRKVAMSTMFPFSKYKLIEIPESVLEIIAEVKIVKNYYEEKGYKVPPTTDIWIYDLKEAGTWNGTKLEIDKDYLIDKTEPIRAARMITLAHEYWHSVYQFNKYNPQYKWLDECMATSFEGQVNPSCESWYINNILPSYEQFFNTYPAKDVGESLRTGFVFTGKHGTDAHQVKRGYQLWPWGKFLLASQGHSEIRELLSGNISEKQFSSYFTLFCKSLLINDFSIGDLIDESLKFDNTPINYSVPSGWNKLPNDEFIASTALLLGNSKTYKNDGVFSKPVPLSFNVLSFTPDGVSEKAPLIVRRSEPDTREEFILIPSDAKPDINGRYVYDEIFNDMGNVVLPGDRTQRTKVASKLTIINSAVEENLTEYFGYGENPLYAYYLRKPRQVDMKEETSKMVLTWTIPELDKGLEEKDIISGYKVYLTNGKSIQEYKSLGLDVKSLDIQHLHLSGYEKIGVATIDKIIKDEKGKLLSSEIHWIPIKALGGSWVKVNETYGYNFGDKEGMETSATHSNYMSSYQFRIGSGFAETINSNNGRYTVDVETASFKHTWGGMPATIKPGQEVNLSIGVVNNNSSGKNALTLFGETQLTIYPGNINEKVQAGGGFYKGMSWENESKKTFKWKIPQPDQLTLTDPKKYRLKVGIKVSSRSNGETIGYATIEYEYRA